MNRVHAGIVAALILLLAACSAPPRRPPPPAPPQPGGDALPREEPRARSGNPPFYEVNGERYVVLASAAGYAEQGVASWYGPDFHGKRTATGETYDMDAMTGAHPTLPLPAWVQVTNLQNGRSVVVRLNDRGPFARNRIIDLSRQAALELDMVRAGTALVEVRSLVAGETPPAPPAVNHFFAQAGAFAEEANATRLAERLRASGIEGVAVTEARADGRRLFRVRAGPVASVGEFDRLIERLRAAGADSPRLALQ
ncbi:MAG TPA: septal ring lytic transglycosylase RlpA family protein [Steroidobacteraceae bacterium]|nr:septal ring lytic transglycosylase RlpA family protein [Steroidobacteraceae bacterium]